MYVTYLFDSVWAFYEAFLNILAVQGECLKVEGCSDMEVHLGHMMHAIVLALLETA